MTDVRPLAAADGCDGFWVFGETAPSLAGGIDDVGVGLEDAVGEKVRSRYCQICSTGFNSGERDGRKISVMFFGTVSILVVCHPARSSSSTACDPRATMVEISSRCICMASVPI